MTEGQINPQDKFYFYNSSIGDLTRYIHKYTATNLHATPGFVTNAFGVKVNPKHLPEVLAGREGVEPIPIPANWHTDIAEIGAALRAVDLARKKFTVVELGCGWGCWLNITGVVARMRGLCCQLIGVEGDEGHVRFAHESLTENGFSSDTFVIHHGIAAATRGMALFPIQEREGVSWGLEAKFDVPDDEADRLCRTGKYRRLKQTPLDALAPEDGSQIDLLHIDIQGGESTLVPSSLKFLNDKVAFMLIGTHSRQIEGGLFDCLIEAGWVLEVERPAVIGVGRNIQTLVDGVQAWRNPRLLPDEMIDLAEPIGSLVVVEPRKQVKLNEQFSLLVKVSNRSTSDWSSTCSTPVRISYHWLGNRNEAVIFDGVRTDFSGGFLYAGTDITQSIQVVAPSKRGKYRLNVTVVQETVRWFADPAFRSATCDISVTE